MGWFPANKPRGLGNIGMEASQANIYIRINALLPVSPLKGDVLPADEEKSGEILAILKRLSAFHKWDLIAVYHEVCSACDAYWFISLHVLLAATISPSGTCLSSCLLFCRWRAVRQERRLRCRRRKPDTVESSLSEYFGRVWNLVLSFLSEGAAGSSAVSVLLPALVPQHEWWNPNLQSESHPLVLWASEKIQKHTWGI